MLTPAIVFITAALLFYTAGVWAEHLKKELRWSHVVLFGLGLVCDVTGTELMRRIAASGGADFSGSTAGILTSVMAITGALALVLMAVHLIWAIVVMVRGTEQARATFHRFSLIVWAIWLVPYFTGMAGAMIG
ncbi:MULTISPECIES: HsmA family protein [Brevibacterium]|uniref:HsmA family protein n=1 Tax=Brevibacterium TaxID=1696 RepID=UPI000C78EED6|nr:MULTISPECIES: HsmA family protein [Brevibacterium]QCP05056.1 TIGR03987 family protein [Brevibacterium sp. CS2]